MNIGELTASLGIDVNELQRNLSAAQQRLAQFTAQSSKGLEQLQFGFAKTGQGVDKVGKDLQELEGVSRGVLARMKEHWLAVSIAIAVAGGTAKKGWDWLRDSAAVQEQKEILDSLARKHKTTADDIIVNMKRMAGGQISSAEAISSATRALMMSIAPAQLVELTRVAEKYGDVLRISVVDALQMMNRAAVTGMSRQLKMMGIIVDITGAHAKYAEQLGTTVEFLTEEEKAYAGINAILDATKSKMGTIESSTLSLPDRLEALSKDWEDLIREMKSAILLPVGEWFFATADAIDAFQVKVGLTEGVFDRLQVKVGLTEDLWIRFRNWLHETSFALGLVNTDVERLATSINSLARIPIKSPALPDVKELAKIGVSGMPPRPPERPESMEKFKESVEQFMETKGEAFNRQQAFERQARETRGAVAAEVEAGRIESLEKFNAQFSRMTLDTEALAITSFHKELEEYRKLIDQKIISSEQFRQFELAGYAKIRNESKKVTDEMTQFAIQAARNMQTAFADFFFNAMTGRLNDLKSILKSVEDTIARMVSQILAQKVATALFGNFGSTNVKGGGPGGGGLIGGFFKSLGFAKGGVIPGPFIPIHAFQEGGIITKPTLGLIGEGGQSEAIIPLDKLEGLAKEAPTIHQYNISINAMDSKSFRDFAKNNRDILMEITESARKDFHPTRRGV